MSEPTTRAPTPASSAQARFVLRSRILHWLMAAMILSMLFIGVAMVSSIADYHRLVAIHRPLGIAILLLALVRVVNRKLSTLPPFPATMSARERKVVHYSELLMYALFLAMPLIGWGMLSAGSFPIVMFGPFHLPPILPANPMLYDVLRRSHTILAFAFFGVILAHLSGVLLHTLIIRDGVLDRMAIWPTKHVRARDPVEQREAPPSE